eukprot:gene58055-biopygen86285
MSPWRSTQAGGVVRLAWAPGLWRTYEQWMRNWSLFQSATEAVSTWKFTTTINVDFDESTRVAFTKWGRHDRSSKLPPSWRNPTPDRCTDIAHSFANAGDVRRGRGIRAGTCGPLRRQRR